MSTGIQKKIRSFLGTRDDLLKRYLEIHQTQVDPNLRQSLTDLYEFDQLCYSYYALKSYYDLSKSRWDLDYRNLLDDLASLHSRIEDKIPVAELYLEIPEVKVLRREFRENAKEGGKVAFLIVSLSTQMSVLNEMIGLSSGTPIINGTPEERSEEKDKQQESGKEHENAKEAGSQKPVSTVGQKPVSSASQIPVPPVSRNPVSTASQQPMSTVHENIQAYRTSQLPSGLFPRTEQLLHGTPLPRAPQFASSQQVSQTTNGSGQLLHATNIPNYALGAAQTPNSQNARSTQLVDFLPPVSTFRSNEAYSTSKRRSFSPVPDSKRLKSDNAFNEFKTWTREHNLCIFRAVLERPYQSTAAIQLALLEKFGVSISQQAAATLELHYGYSERTKDNYQYYIQAFQLVASQFHDNPSYVIVPWADIRLQFARKTGLTLDDWEVRDRYLLFLLHRRIYGASGEPPSNYSDLVEEWKKVAVIRSHLSTLGNHNQASIQRPSGLEFQSRNTSISVDDEEHTWTPELVNILIEAHCKLPKLLSNRMMAIQHFIKLKTGKAFDVQEVERRLKWRDVDIGVANMIRERAQADARQEQTNNAEGQSQRQSEGQLLAQLEPQNQRLSEEPVSQSTQETSHALSQRKDGESATEPALGPAVTPATGTANGATNGVTQVTLTSPVTHISNNTADRTQTTTTNTFSIAFTNTASTSSTANTVTSSVITNSVANTTANIAPESKSVTSADTSRESAAATSPKSSANGPSQFDQLLSLIELLNKPEWYYMSKMKPSVYTDFWDFEKCKCVYITVEYLSTIPPDTSDLTLRVARTNLKKMVRLRLLRGFKIKVLESLVENKLMNMMEQDVFGPAMVEVIKNAL